MNLIRTILSRLGVTILDLLTSKKAIATAVAAIVGFVVKDENARNMICASIMSYVVGQGIADHGKAIAEAKLGIAGAAPLPVAVVDGNTAGSAK